VQERAERVLAVEIDERVADRDLEPEALGARAQHRQRLRVAVGIDEERPGAALADPLGHRHRLGGGGRLIQQRGVGELEPGQLGGHLLKDQQRFEPALADLGLIGRVGGVPTRIFHDVAEDHGRRDRAVVAHADHRGQHAVLRRH
jgi:hypothetical protein